MNIEEERKAFEASFESRSLEKSEVQEGVYIWPYTNGAWDGWLAAKAHAEEMAKPTVRILPKRAASQYPAYPFVLSLWEGENFNGVLEDFHTVADAEQWAKDNGYRVVSE